MALGRTRVNFMLIVRQKNESITRYTHNYIEMGYNADLTTKRECIYWLYNKFLRIVWLIQR
jgi:hypothetical protein